jgi:hypothetical protein
MEGYSQFTFPLVLVNPSDLTPQFGEDPFPSREYLCCSSEGITF